MLKKKQDMLLVAATVIAAMAYQAGLNPPGGVWDKDRELSIFDSKNITFRAGTSDLAAVNPKAYTKFWIFNTLSFISSLSIILVVVSGLPLLKKRAVMWLLTGAVWLTTSFMALTYLVTLPAITPWDSDFNGPQQATFKIELSSAYVWFVLMGLILLVHGVRIVTWINKVWKDQTVSNDQGEGRGV